MHALEIRAAYAAESDLRRTLAFVVLPFVLLVVSGNLLCAAGQARRLEASSSASSDVAKQDSTKHDPMRHDGAESPLVIDGMQVGNVYEFNRSVEVRGEASGVMVVGGDLIVRGRVTGDVATIGGDVYQAEDSFIGGDVIVLGGAYHHGDIAPGRDPKSATVMVAGFEEELREMARTPASLLAPQPTPAYIGARLLSVLFWFVVSLALTAIAPGVIGGACASLQLTPVRVASIGFLALVVVLCGVPLSLRFLPAPLAAIVGTSALLLVAFAYLFGRVALHAVTGRWLQRRLFPSRASSESIALLLGVLFWVFLLSLPYVWTLVVGGLLVVSLGLTLTTRSPTAWKRAPATKNF